MHRKATDTDGPQPVARSPVGRQPVARSPVGRAPVGRLPVGDQLRPHGDDGPRVPLQHPKGSAALALSLQRAAGNRATSLWLAVQRAPEGSFGERPSLDLKDSGPGVQLLQRRLADAGHKVPITGVFDAATHDAVVAYQQEHPELLPATGGVGEKTWRALDRKFMPAESPMGNFGSRPNIELGNNGPGVRLLQLRLNKAGIPVPVNGVFGQATHQAVVAYQQARVELLPATGGVGPLTWKALDAPFVGITPTLTAARVLQISPLERNPRGGGPGFGLISQHEYAIDPDGANPFDIVTREVVSEGAPPNPPFQNVGATNGPQGENAGRLQAADIHFVNRSALVETGKLAPGIWRRHQEYQFKSSPTATNPGQTEWKTFGTYEIVREVLKGDDGRWHFRTSLQGEEPVDQIIE